MKDIEERLEEVKKFSEEALKRHPELIKSIVLVGSVARGDFKTTSDTDVLVVLDDSRQPISWELSFQIREELVGIAKKISKRIYVVDPPISAIQLIRNAESYNPYVYVDLKEGIAIYDIDFFVPFQDSFLNTRKFARASCLSKSLTEQAKDLRKMEIDLRHSKRVRRIDYINCMISSANFLLMGMGVEPSAPVKIPNAVEEHLIKPGFLERKYANWLKKTISSVKRIEHHPLRYGRKRIGNSIKSFRRIVRFVKEMQRVFTAQVKPDVLILMTDGGEKLDRKFPKDKSLSVSKNIMRELADKLYLTRREFLKAVGVGAAAGTAGLSGCLEYIKPKTPTTVKKRFTPELKIVGSEI